MRAATLSTYGGYRRDGLYAEGPASMRCVLGAYVGTPLAPTQRATDAALHEQTQARARRRARQAEPAPVPARQCRKAVRVLGPAPRGRRG